MKFLGDHIILADVLKKDCSELLQLKFETINICNIQCDFCRTNALNRNDQQEKSLGVTNFIKLLDEAILLGLQIVSFEGKGEPFLDPDFLEYLKYSISKNLYIKIHTNLTFLNGSDIENKGAFIELVKNYKKLSLITTLANRTDLKRIKKHIKILKEWNYLSKDSTRLAARLLVFGNNKTEIIEFFEFCLAKNIYPRVQLFYNLGRAKDSHKSYLSKKELRAIYNDLESIIKKNESDLELPTFPGYKAFPLYYTLTVDSNSNVKYYPEFDEKLKQNLLGNLNDMNLTSLWNSDQAKRMRNPKTHNTGKCLMCPKKQEGCYGDKIQSIIMCGGEFEYTDIFCWFNESENRNLPQQIIDKLNEELTEELGNNIVTIGVLNDWEKAIKSDGIKDLKSLFDEGNINFSLTYVLPSQLEQNVISSMDQKVIKAFIDTEKYIFGKGKDDFSTLRMKSSTNYITKDFIRKWAIENRKLRKGVKSFEKILFQDFKISTSETSSRNVMFVSMIKHKFVNNPFGLVFITLPESYLKKKKDIRSILNQKILKYSNYLYEAILKSWYVRLSTNLDDILDNCQENEIGSLIVDYLYCAFLLTNVEKSEADKYFKEFEINNYNYFINLKEFLDKSPFSLGDYIYDLIKLKLQTLIRWKAKRDAKIMTMELLVSAKKSAIAAVMSRNMSHNYGSHSLVYLGKEDNLRGEKYNKTNQLIITKDFNNNHNLY